MKVRPFLIVIVLAIIAGILVLFVSRSHTSKSDPQILPSPTPEFFQEPLSILHERVKSYPGSDITIEQTLETGSNYHQYITSYWSDGLKIYALLTVPDGQIPIGGFPAIIFNHGYIPPEQYTTTGRYGAYVDSLARAGYVVFKPDFRGHGNSEGNPEGAYYSPAYMADVLNAVSSVKKLKDPEKGNSSPFIVNSQKIGMWGHSMGGNITMRSLVVDAKDIKAAVIWSGVVGTYEELSRWHDPHYMPSQRQLALRNKYRSELIKKYGHPSMNSPFWKSIDPRSFVADITTPIQIHQSLEDEEVPPNFAQSFVSDLKKNNKTVEYYEYPTGDHNLSQDYDAAMSKTIEFFDTYLK